MQPELITVTQLTSTIKTALESSFPEVYVEGEISNFRPAASGHWYFTLKDRDAQIEAVLFRGSQRNVTATPRDGQLVRVRGALSVYAKRGRYQVICTTLEPSGEGAILAMLSERRRRLAAEGLFDRERKRELPRYPRRVAVVTSATGAAIRDFLSVLRRRSVNVGVVVYPTPVQGDDAAPRIRTQILRAGRQDDTDVIVVSRGGGSIEDLLPFSDESVVRAISEVSTPTISAVGHEIDYSLADLAADLRAPTPTAAAEIIAGLVDSLRDSVLESGRSIGLRCITALRLARRRVEAFSTEEILYRYRNYIQPWNQRLDEGRYRLQSQMTALLERTGSRVRTARAQIDALSPRKVLERGFAIVRDVSGRRIIDGAGAASSQQSVEIEWHDGHRRGHIE